MRGFKLSLEERQREFSEELRATSKGALASIRHWNRVVQVFGILMLCGALFFGWLNSRVFAKEDHADALVDVLNNSIDLNRESIQVLVKIQHAGTLTPEKQEELARIVETSLEKVNAVNALFDAKKLGIKPKKRKT